MYIVFHDEEEYRDFADYRRYVGRVETRIEFWLDSGYTVVAEMSSENSPHEDIGWNAKVFDWDDNPVAIIPRTFSYAGYAEAVAKDEKISLEAATEEVLEGILQRGVGLASKSELEEYLSDIARLPSCLPLE